MPEFPASSDPLSQCLYQSSRPWRLHRGTCMERIEIPTSIFGYVTFLTTREGPVHAFLSRQRILTRLPSACLVLLCRQAGRLPVEAEAVTGGDDVIHSPCVLRCLAATHSCEGRISSAVLSLDPRLNVIYLDEASGEKFQHLPLSAVHPRRGLRASLTPLTSVGDAHLLSFRALHAGQCPEFHIFSKKS